MKQNFKMVFTLCLIGFISAVVLSQVYLITQPVIKLNEKKEKEAAIYKVVSEAVGYEEVKIGPINAFRCYDAGGQFCGLAFTAEGVGYQDLIRVMVGLSPDFEKIMAIEVLDNNETPGLGSKITTSWFQDQFVDLSAAAKIAVVKQAPQKKSQIQAITGATISSEAVVSIISEKLQEIREYR